MRIGLVNDYPPHTGIGNYAFSLFSELKKREKDVDMMYLQYDAPLEMSDERIKVIKTPLKLPVLRKTLNWSYYFPKRIPEGYDVYHVSSQYLSKVAKYRKPCVVSCMDIFPVILEHDYPYPLRVMTKKALEHLKYADAIIAISEYSKKELVNYLKIPEEKVYVVYLGVDTDVFKPRDKREARKTLGLPLDKKIILHVGSEEPRKNVPTIIKAFSELQKKIPDVLFMRIGERRKPTFELIKRLGLEKTVRYYRGIPKEALARFYSAADLFVFPSLNEGFGLPVLEAMACETPVLAANFGSLPEIVDDESSFINPLDVEDLKGKMENVLSDANLRKAMCRRGSVKAGKFSWLETAKSTLEIYNELV